MSGQAVDPQPYRTGALRLRNDSHRCSVGFGGRWAPLFGVLLGLQLMGSYWNVRL